MKKSRKSFRRKLAKNAKNLKIGGLGQFGDLPLTGPKTPDLAGPSYSPGGPDKNSFYSEGIDPHLGEIWGFEILNITVFEPIMAMSLQRTRNDINLHVPSRYADRKCNGRPSAALRLDSVHAECCNSGINVETELESI